MLYCRILKMKKSIYPLGAFKLRMRRREKVTSHILHSHPIHDRISLLNRLKSLIQQSSEFCQWWISVNTRCSFGRRNLVLDNSCICTRLLRYGRRGAKRAGECSLSHSDDGECTKRRGHNSHLFRHLRRRYSRRREVDRCCPIRDKFQPRSSRQIEPNINST